MRVAIWSIRGTTITPKPSSVDGIWDVLLIGTLFGKLCGGFVSFVVPRITSVCFAWTRSAGFRKDLRGVPLVRRLEGGIYWGSRFGRPVSQRMGSGMPLSGWREIISTVRMPFHRSGRGLYATMVCRGVLWGGSVSPAFINQGMVRMPVISSPIIGIPGQLSHGGSVSLGVWIIRSQRSRWRRMVLWV